MEKLNQWLMLVANIGVVAGIVFLGVETSQNTQTMRGAAIQASTDVARQQILFLADVAEDDATRDFWINRSAVIGMQGLYRQWKMGILPDEEWGMWERVLCWNADHAKWKELWPENAKTLIPEFVSHVERICQVGNGDPLKAHSGR